MQTLNDLFKIILEGDKESSRNSARNVSKSLHSSNFGRDKYEDIKRIIDNADETYKGIKEEWRQENFVVAISVIYFLHDREDEPDFLFPWFFYLIQNDNGNIRQSAVRMFRHELGPLTVHIRCPEYNCISNKILNEKHDKILFYMYDELLFLLNKFYRPSYKKYKYVSSLPTGPYKSMQLVIDELESDCGEEYVDEIRKKLL
jgi:hypothetical protein